MSRGLAVLVSIIVFMHGGLGALGRAYAAYGDDAVRLI
jgi:hypothetical protein